MLARNWKTRFCEIDIVAENEHSRLFVEVKYRRRSTVDGIAAITPLKLRKMRFAAELYGVRFPTLKSQRLAVVAVSPGAPMRLLEVE